MEIIKSHCFGVGKKPQDGAQRQTRRMFSSTTELKRDCLPIPTSLAGVHHVEVNETLMSPVGRHAPHSQDPPAVEKGGLWSPSESYSFLSVCCLSIGCAVCPAFPQLFLLAVWVLSLVHPHHGPSLGDFLLLLTATNTCL